MKRKLSVLLLFVVLIMALTGCCFHKEWSDPTCETPKTCIKCGETEGQPLGHIWQPRNTEVPETCSRCAATRGERIITDPRFTTAATEEFYGTWEGTTKISGKLVSEELASITMPAEITVTLHNDSAMEIFIKGTDVKPFEKALREYLRTQLEAEAAGLTQFTFAEYMAIVYETTAEAYVDEQMKAIDLSALTQGYTIEGVYYVEGNQFHAGLGWDADLNSFTFQKSGDTMLIQGDLTGMGQDLSHLNRFAD